MFKQLERKKEENTKAFLDMLQKEKALLTDETTPAIAESAVLPSLPIFHWQY